MRFLDEDQQTGSPDAPRSAATALALWRAVRKHWALAVPVAIAVTLAVAFHTLGQTKIYRSSATLQFDPRPPKPLGHDVQAVVELGPGTWWNNQEYYQTQFQIIRSTRVALAVVKELNLERDAHFLANAPPQEQVSSRKASENTAASILIGRLGVSQVQDSRLATVTYEDADPTRAERVLASLIRNYTEQNLEQVLQSTDQAVDWLTEQLEVLKKDLEKSELELHDYKSRNQILSVSMDDQSNMLRDEMEALNRALTDARTKREAIAARKAELDKIKAEDPENLPASELLDSALVQELRSRYIDAKRARDSMIAGGRGEMHPEVQAADAAVETARKALLAEVENIKKALQHDHRAATREVAGLSGLFEQAKESALRLNLLQIEYNRLRRTKDNNEKLYEIVMERSKEGDLTRMLRFNNITVLEPASSPASPVRPNVPLNVSLGLLAGLGLGIMVAFVRDFADRSIKTPEDVETNLNVTCLGLLPLVEETAAVTASSRKHKRRANIDLEEDDIPELVVHNASTSGAAEAARAIRTNLMFMSPDKPFKRLLVTSSAPKEGKTMVATSMAIAMAQAGQRVLLMDCDLRRPRVHKVFRRENQRGVTTAVVEPGSIDQVEFDTDIPNLSVMTSGPVPPNPAELLHSERFQRLLDQLGERFDRIIIDSPPLAPVTDAAILSSCVDGTLMVVRAFQTRRDLASRAVRTLKDVKGRLVGVVLNSVDFRRHEYGSSYQYYYYRHEGYAANSTRPGADQRSS